MTYLKFLWSLLRHKWFVFRAGIVLHIPLWRLIIHDLSKFSPAEYGRYARNFCGPQLSDEHGKSIENDFTFAWLHHENRNAHHWGYWVPRSGRSAGKPLPMPEVAVREMIADWMGASRAYTGAWDIASWINKNGPQIKIHDETLGHIWTIMIELEYFITDNCDWSWMASQKTMGILSKL